LEVVVDGDEGTTACAVPGYAAGHVVCLEVAA
jgi:hypothetical protein